MGKLIVLIIVAVLLVSLVLIKTNEISGNAAYDKDEIFIPVTVHLVKEKSSLEQARILKMFLNCLKR